MNIGTFLVGFASGVVSVIVLELLGLENLLDFLRGPIELLLGLRS